MKDFDYASPSAYFLTIVSKERKCEFGEINAGKMALNEIGKIVLDAWLWLKDQYSYIILDEYCVMPNHLHGIILIQENDTNRKTLGRLVGAFKTISTKRVNLMMNTPRKVLWQRNYFDHVIRDERDLDRVRTYIQQNPYNWNDDDET